MAVDWSYYDKFEAINDKYLPLQGEGETIATQIVTAVNKLVYKWYNDGDVFDNTYILKGWANDLSSYANWLEQNIKTSHYILCGVVSCYTESDYEDLLKTLADKLLDENYLEKMNTKKKQNSIYDCDGLFKYKEYSDDDYDEEYDEDGDDA